MRFILAPVAGVPLLVLLAACSVSAPSEEAAGTAIVILVDASGSLAGPPAEALKEACVAALREGGDKIHMGVLAFNAETRWLRPLGSAGELGAMKMEGGADLVKALEEALRGLRRGAPAGARKRIILLSDGDLNAKDVESAVNSLAEEGAVVSAICVACSPRFDAALLSQVAGWGEGRFFFTTQPKSLPQLLVEEVRRSLLN